jgi:hypothetical protein
MAKQHQKAIDELKALLAAKNRGPLLAIRVIDEDPATVLDAMVARGEIADSQRRDVLVIERVAVEPPDRPEEEPPVIPASPSPRTVQPSRMAEFETRRPLDYSSLNNPERI